jgi:hypothetical protein
MITAEYKEIFRIAWPYQTTSLEIAEHGTRIDPRNNDQSLTLLIKVSA